MTSRLPFLLSTMALSMMQLALAQVSSLTLPKSVEAGSAFSIRCSARGKAVLFIVGLGQVLKRNVEMGGTTFFRAGSLYNAGHYLVTLESSSSAETRSFDVVPAAKPAEVSFLAKPSRVPAGLQDGITGAVYVFDVYHNLIAVPTPVSFELSSPSGDVQRRTVTTRNGSGRTVMDSTAQQGIDKFVARVADISSTRIVGQVPGDPCGLKVSARQSGKKLLLATDPVRDCNGNAVPDGTIVTFTEAYKGGQSTVDVPLKHGIGAVQMAVHNGASISVASGIVLGNQIRWEY
jgi:hypothetical protein